MLKFMVPLALATLFIYQLAEAQETAPGVEAREQHRRDRFRQDAAPGEAARDEARRFMYERRDMQRAGMWQGDAGIDGREARQREAIRRGVESGELTPREADRLRREQARIERHERMAEADGRVTPRERARLNRELDRSARDIWRESHDRQRMAGRDRGRNFGERHPHGERIAWRGRSDRR